MVTQHNSIFEEGRNCWVCQNSDRVAFLVDAALYFSSLVSVFEQARHSIYIVGWSFDHRLQLIRDRDGKPFPPLGEYLNDLVERKTNLQVYILRWNFTSVFMLDNEPISQYFLSWPTHKRVHFKLDSNHPFSASQHEKIVVVDDAIAFCGGIDLSLERWDSRRHDPADKRRQRPDGSHYQPRHDLQLAMAGEPARKLGSHVRDRWLRVTDESLPTPPNGTSIWPESLPVSMTKVRTALARTNAKWKEVDTVHEIEELYKDLIGAAQHTIYAESQYLTSEIIKDAFIKRLQEQNGPEIVVLSPVECPEWHEEKTMGVMRANVVNEIRDADRHDRFRIYYPVITIDEIPLYLHSKLLIIDDQFVRLGSSNLSNRSLGLDTEMDVCIAAEKKAEPSQAIADFRNDLLAEHLAIPASKIEESIENTGSLIKTIEVFPGNERSMKPIESFNFSPIEEAIPKIAPVDPVEPFSSGELVRQFMHTEQGMVKINRKTSLVLIILLLLSLSALWHFTELRVLITPENLARYFEPLRNTIYEPLAILSAFLLGGFFMVPVTALVFLTGLLFDFWWALGYAMTGSMLSALSTYMIGKRLWPETVKGISRKRLDRFLFRLKKQGPQVVALLRLVPVAPFSVVNLVAGSIGLRIKDYTLGSLLGLLPGTILVVIAAQEFKNVLNKPSTSSIIIILFIIIALIALPYVLKRYVVEGRREK